jgi:hypothetical protein
MTLVSACITIYNTENLTEDRQSIWSGTCVYVYTNKLGPELSGSAVRIPNSTTQKNRGAHFHPRRSWPASQLRFVHILVVFVLYCLVSGHRNRCRFH